MANNKQEVYLDRIEWEGLQENKIIRKNIHSDILKDTANEIEIWRGKDYKIEAKITGIFKSRNDNISNNGVAGELIEPAEISGQSNNESKTFKLKHCYIGNVYSNDAIDINGNIYSKYNADLTTYHVKIETALQSEVTWLTDWYLNSHRLPFFYKRSTSRETSRKYIRNRGMGDEDVFLLERTNTKYYSRDYAFIDCNDIKFILNAVPQKYGPNWSEKMGIEYRREFGAIPEADKREAISEVVSFIIGRQLLNIGSTSFSKCGNPIEEIFLDPLGDNIMSLCQRCDSPPVKLDTYHTMGRIEKVLKKVVPKYLELREDLKLNEVLYRYWISSTLPIGTNLPILANGVEILANAWFKSKKSKVKGVYIQKREFDNLLNEDLKNIEAKLENIEYGDRIMRRMSNTFQLGANERLQFFFDEIGLEVGDIENKAIRARNVMTHGSNDNSDKKTKEMINLTNVYKTLFNRIFLKILGYQENYVDYSTLGHPEKNIDEPSGDNERDKGTGNLSQKVNIKK